MLLDSECLFSGFYIRFPVGNAEYVKQFLLQYSLLRRKEGFLLRHDSLSTSSDAGSGLSIDSDGVVNASGSRLPKQMGQSALPDLLCTSSGNKLLLILGTASFDMIWASSSGHQYVLCGLTNMSLGIFGLLQEFISVPNLPHFYAMRSCLSFVHKFFTRFHDFYDFMRR